MYPFKCLKESIQMRFFQIINDGLSLLIPIHSCSKWKTNWPISKKCSKVKIRRCHLQNQPYLKKFLCYKHNLGVILKLSLKWCTWYQKLKMSQMTLVPGFVGAGHIFVKIWNFRGNWSSLCQVYYILFMMMS